LLCVKSEVSSIRRARSPSTARRGARPSACLARGRRR
jgi:hypothetical protein